MEYKISVMITCYNCEKYIGTAIKSVVDQVFPCSWELLIGDDGSSDNTIKIVKEWIEKYPNNIKLYVMDRSANEEKNGTRAAKNRANLLRHAEGEYLLFLDGDDQFLGNEKIKTQYDILVRDIEKKYACVAHNILANDMATGQKYPLTAPELDEGVVDTKLYWQKLYFHTNTIMFRRECKELMLKDEYCDYLNDNFITYIILQYGQIYYIPCLWGQYNLTGDGLWTGKKRTYGCFRNMIIYDLETKINPKMENESFIRHIYDFRYILKYYDFSDREKVDPLIKGLASERFYYTLLLYRSIDKISKVDKRAIRQLKTKVWFVFYKNRIKNLMKRI